MDKRQLGKGMYIDLVSGSGISVITVMNPHKFFSNDNERFLCLPLLILSALTDFGILFAQVMFSFWNLILLFYNFKELNSSTGWGFTYIGS